MRNSIPIEPKRLAAALSYAEALDNAPVVTAFGAADSAREILRDARRYGIPVVENPELVRKLREAGADHDEIPAELYPEIAQALVEVERRRF